jgi:hypothetical protein
MSERLGYGPLGSLRAYVALEIRLLRRGNSTLRHARYSLPRRLLRTALVERSIGQLLGLYLVVLAIALVGEWAANRYAVNLLPGYVGVGPRDFVKDVGSYLIAAQIGILAIVSVAVGVVTLLSERGDGSSVNTDIRLYYVESYSYELAVSGIALLLVLTLQLFWPLQHILHAAGFGGQDYSFKLALTALHTLWFCLNLILFLQFITTTLRFVEPNSREALRERYSANEVIPNDARRRLLRVLYLNAPSQMFGQDTLKEGPNILFGFSSILNEAAVAEVAATFPRPVHLADIWLRPLQWVLDRWQRRVRARPKGKRQFGQPSWGDQLTILPNFDTALEGHQDLVLRRGDVPLTGFEKWIIRRCLRFSRAATRELDLPTPQNFLEQLIDKLVHQTEQSATTGFRAALEEVVQYHRFILAAQNTTDSSGAPFNLAEVGDMFSRPDADWVRQYRRAFIAAADKIGSDTYFIDRLSNLISRLVPDDGLNFSQRVMQTLLELGLHEVIALEDWVTKRAVIAATSEDAGASASLTGSDKRAYENVLIGFVGGWETLAQVLISSFEIKRRPVAAEPDAQWSAFVKGFPVLNTHLRNAAYFLAAAVWNDDAMGADRFRDLLLRWPQPFYANLQATYVFGNTLLLTPDLVNQDWTTVQADVAGRMRFRQEAALPGPISGVLLWELHCDAVCVSGLVALYWYATGQQPSETAAQAAVLTLRRQKREGDGSDLTATQQKSTFRLLFDFTVRYALNLRFAETRYSAAADELVRMLTNLASPRMVSGRIYGGFGIDGFGTLRPALLAALAANLPARGDDGIAAFFEDLKNDPYFRSDKPVTNFIWTMQQNLQALANIEQDEVFLKAARIMDADLDISAAIIRLRAVFDSLVTGLQTLRKERLRAAPLDEDRMALVRHRMTDGVLANGPGIGCFREYTINRVAAGAIAVQESQFGVIDKGSFTLPEMSQVTFNDLPGIFSDILRSHLAGHLWRDLHQRPKRVLAADLSEGTEEFWWNVVEEARTVGPDPIILVPFDILGEEISAAAQPIPGGQIPGFEIVHHAGMPSGGGTGYMGTIEGIHVYSAHGMVNMALLLSRHLLRSIEYGVVHGRNDVVDFSFVDSDNPESSQVRLIYAQRITWADDVFVEYGFRNEGQE